MTIPVTASVHPAPPAIHSPAEAALRPAPAQAGEKVEPKEDRVTISDSAKQALAQDNHPAPVITLAQQAMESSKAQQAGHALQ